MASRIWAVVTLLIAACCVIVGVSLISTDSATLGQVTVMLGMIATTIPALLASQNSEETKKNTAQLNDDLRNGTFEKLLREAIIKIAADSNSQVNIVSEDEPREEADTS